MAITKTEILTFVNDVLNREETDIDVPLRLVVDDLADLHALEDVDGTQTLTSTSWYLSYPTDCLDTEEAIVSVQLKDSAGLYGPRLKVWPGGWRDHVEYSESNPSRSVPAWYAINDRKIYIDPRPASDYTATIHYYRRHGSSLTTLDFTDDWKRCILFGTVLEVACKYGLVSAVNLWGGRYEREKDRRRILMR